MGAIKKSAKKASTSKKSTGLGGKLAGIASSALGGSKGGGGGGKRRRRGATYYANELLKAKLKKKLFRVKYGGR